MKRILSVVALLMVAMTTAPIAEAKRFGGGKSFGKKLPNGSSASTAATKHKSCS